MTPLMLSSVFLITGIVLGLLFFGGLWATVKGLKQSHHPALRMLVSLILRFGLVLVGFYVLTHFGEWQHLLVAGVGFTLPRFYFVRRMQSEQIKKESVA